MMITKLPEFEDVLLLEPNVYRDDRGYFLEQFNYWKLNERIGHFDILQINQSKSKRGVIRGLHFQKPPFTQAKIVQVIKGQVLDVIVDIRTDSQTFGRHTSILLNGTNKYQLYVPRGFAHGFITLSKDAIFQYYVDNQYAPNYESGIRFDDKELDIDWIMKRKLIINDKDKVLPLFSQQVFNTRTEYSYNPVKLDY